MSASQKIYVIHGHGGYGLQIAKICNTLIKEGYTVENFTYRSLSVDVDEVAKKLFAKIRNENVDSVSFVTFSLGVLVVRSMMLNLTDSIHFPFINKFVMIAPPNKGTPVADKYYPNKIIRFFAGPNLYKLTTQYHSQNLLPVLQCESGAIFGIKGDGRGYNTSLNADNDGYLVPEQSILGNEAKIAYVKASHNALPQQRKVREYVLNFLRNGSFN